MKLVEVKERLAEIMSLSDDCEVAHVYEDSLFNDFVCAIIAGEYETKDEITTIAVELYKVKKIEFGRFHN